MKIFILFVLVTLTLCHDDSNLYDSDPRPPVGCGHDVSLSGASHSLSGDSSSGSSSGGSISSGGSSSGSSSGESISSGGSKSSGESSWEGAIWDGSLSEGSLSEGSLWKGSLLSEESLSEGSLWKGSSYKISSYYSSYNFTCTSEYHNDLKDDDQCLPHALEKVPDLFNSLMQVMCKYSSDKADYDELTVEMTKVMKCAGCGISHARAWKEVRHTTEDIGKLGGKSVWIVYDDVMKHIGLTKSLLDVTCNMLGPALASTCVKELTSKQISSMNKHTKAILCYVSDDLDLLEMYHSMGNIDCLVDKTLTVEEETFKELISKLGEFLLPSVNNLAAELKKVPLVNELLCTVEEVLRNVVNGGGKGGILSGVDGLLGGK